MAVKITTESFKKEIYDLYGNDYTLLSEYKLSHVKVKMRHNVCGHEYEVTPNKFKMGRKCPECANKSRGIKLKKSKEQLQRELNEYYGREEYTILSEEIGKDR